ncbi:MAG: hypothetical protein K2Y17_10920 [Qipengyuania sp.]|nr:hypothetical protein [Qipengyuania sp.]
MTRCLSLGLLFSLPFAPLHAQPAGWELVNQARNAASICVGTQAVRLDDKRTSPEIIARAAFRACKVEIDGFSSAYKAKAIEMMPTDPNGERDALIESGFKPFVEDLENFAIQAILEVRVKK